MAKTIFTDAHAALVEVLIKARTDAGLHQIDVAAELGRHQSFMSNIERLQRRVDVIEFIAIAKAMDIDPVRLFEEVCEALP